MGLVHKQSILSTGKEIAQNLFSKLDFKRESHYSINGEINWIGYRKENFYLDDYLLIVFDCLEKGIRFEMNNLENVLIDPKMLKAINMQVQELGWLNEE